MAIFYLPLQPLEERYTKMWYSMFRPEIEKQGQECILIGGRGLSESVDVGTFADINSSICWFSSQVQQVARLFRQQIVKDGDIFFLADCEMFGLEGSIKYLATLNDVKIKICGFAHAGSYTKEDFVEQCSFFAWHYEDAWYDIFDKIFVGSEYHKKQLVACRHLQPDKIFVTGNPYDIDSVQNILLPSMLGKRDRVICTNRPDQEKRPGLTLGVFEKLKTDHPDWEFMVTTSRKEWGKGDLRGRALRLEREGIITIEEGLSKIEYLTLLAESKVMTGNSIEENFGYVILESLIVDTIPIVGKAFSHLELLEDDERCLFRNPFHQKQLIEEAMKNPFSVKHHANQYRSSLSKIVGHLA